MSKQDGKPRVGKYRFSDGKFDADNSISDEPESDGWRTSQHVGDQCGLSYSLFEKQDEPWIVIVNTAAEYCLIACYTWPDLIELLAKLAPIAISGWMNEEWQMAIADLLEPTIAARRRAIQKTRRKT
jgi:hypothetical protein